MDPSVWKILLVEDDEDDFFLTGQYLAASQRSRFCVEWAKSYQRAREMLASEEYDAVLMDYDLGERTGTELTRLLTAGGFKTPIILLTGQGSYEIDLEAMQSGAMDYLVKGEINGAVLERAIRYAIERRKIEESLEAHVQERTHDLNRILEDLREEVAERKRVETALRTSENRLRTVLNSAPLVLWSVDREGKINLLEGQALAAHPFVPGQPLVPQMIHDLNNSDDLQECIQRALTGEEVIVDVHMPQGQVFETWLGPEWDEQGEIIGAVAVSTDVTARRQAEEALRRANEALEARVAERTADLSRVNSILLQSEKEYRQLADAMPQLVWTSRPDGSTDYINQRFIQFDGMRKQANGVWDWIESVYPDDQEKLSRAWQKSIQTGKDYQVEARLAMADGTHRWHLIRALPMRDEQGGIVRWFGTATDIQEQKHTQEEQRESAERMRLVQEAVHLASWQWDPEGNHITVSPESSSLFGLDPDTPDFYDNWFNGIPPEDQHIMRNKLRHAIKTGKMEVEYRYTPPGQAGTRWLYSKGGVVTRGHGSRVLMGIVLDITQRKHAEQNARFLADLGDALLNLMEPDEIFSLVSSRLGQYLNAQLCFLDEVNLDEDETHIRHGYSPEVPEFEAQLRLEDLPPDLVDIIRRGEMAVVEDTQDGWPVSEGAESIFQTYQVRSFVVIPRLKEGGWVGSLSLAYPGPHSWQAEELELLTSAADLAWLAIDNARTYQIWKTTEERFRVALSHAPITVYTTDRELRYTWIYNPPENLKVESFLGKRDDEVFSPEDARGLIALKQSVIETGQRLRTDFTLNLDGQTTVYDLSMEPLLDRAGQVVGLKAAAMEITQQRLLETQQMEHHLLVQVQRRLMRHREEERLQIARDLHDGPLQELIAVGYGLNEALGITDRPGRLKRMVQLQEAIQRQIRELRAFCGELRPPTLMHFGLERAIRSHAESFQEKHPNLHVDLDLMEDGRILAEDVRLAIFRIYQELMNNVAKHAGAEEVTVQLNLDESMVELDVYDNGIGFDVPEHWLELASEGHLGLVGIHERAEVVGGTVKVISSPDHGTLARVIVPLDPVSAGPDAVKTRHSL